MSVTSTAFSVQTFPLAQTHQFSDLFLNYLAQKPSLASLYQHFPTQENFAKQIALKQSFPQESRRVLVQELQKQYASLEISEQVQANISALASDKTFTITTGHQLNIFTGPLYFIYKIVTVIKAAEQLRQQYPQYNFVPVYWAATEDHDAAEINHFSLFGKKYTWETAQTGAVGRFALDGLETVLESLPEKYEIFEKAYRNHANLADATRCFINNLFGDKGLLMLDADSHELKLQLREVMRRDLYENATQKATAIAEQVFESEGHKPQIYVREINFFYLDKGVRERIISENGVFKVLNTDWQFTAAQMEEIINETPEKLSPNVALRPVYQEIILPNLSYTGGPAEIVYWLQLKPVFDALQLPFPILLPRNFALLVSKANHKKLQKLDVTATQLLAEDHVLKQEFLAAIGESFSADEERLQLLQLFAALEQKAVAIDKTLQDFVKAEAARTEKTIEGIEKRIRKAEEKKHETAISQLLALKQKLYPNGGLQERSENFLNYYTNNPQLIDDLLESLNPFDMQFYVLTEQE